MQGLPSEALNAHRAEVIAIVERHKATNVRVFGSVARGEDTPDSDIDLLVTYGPDMNFIDLVDMVDELQALLGHPVDLVSDKALHGGRREPAILRDAIPL